MRVRFWGTRGSIATPGPGTNYFGGNTSCVELTTANGDLLIFDCGTGAHRLAAELMAQGNKPISANILLGHTHWDHIQGFPFFDPAFVKGNSVAIYGPQGSRGSLHDVLAGHVAHGVPGLVTLISRRGHRIAFRRRGQGSTVLMLHGFPTWSYDYAEVANTWLPTTT